MMEIYLPQTHYFLINEINKIQIMIFDVRSELINRFLKFPETGMG